ncbi:phage tail protein [Tamlana sp. 62-3]|uniref:Phage tail protein n=1 Tax=Neotamlana sargassicola TaxID=2883125 RepID=A0A9X1I5V4_9FLAO|nr:phage tail protein [Tamlana sargassicola]MCB4807400.1 phage tail protein [Tamlana sargassicola]
MSNYPLSTNRFTVSWGGNRIGVSEVIGLSLEIEPIKYTEGSFVTNGPILMPGQQKKNTIILKRGLIKNDNDYYNWINSAKGNTIERRDITISLLNENKEPEITWKLLNAFPIKLQWSDLKANTNEPAMEILEIVYENIHLVN